MLNAVEGVPRLLEVMRCVPLFMLKVVEIVRHVLELLEAIRCVL